MTTMYLLVAKKMVIVSYYKYCMFRSQQHDEHVCYGHSLDIMQMLIAIFLVLFISMIEYVNLVLCMNCKAKEIN